MSKLEKVFRWGGATVAAASAGVSVMEKGGWDFELFQEEGLLVLSLLAALLGPKAVRRFSKED